MPNAIDLCTLAQVRAWVGSVTTNDDALLQSLITNMSQMITDYLSRPIVSANYTETRNGNGNQQIVTSNYPISAVASVTIDDQAIPLSTNTTTAGYIFDDSTIYLRGSYCFTRSKQNVQITYTAGYTTIPYSISQVCQELAAWKYRERDRIGQVSKRIEGEVVTFSQKDLSDSQKLMLCNYINVVPL